MAWNSDDKKTDTKRTGPSKVMEIRVPGKDMAGDKSNRDLGGGMEMLDMDFLLSVVENTTGNDKNDVTMRKLVFNELMRRDQVSAIDSHALKVYTLDDDRLYGKDIQCEAMKKLADRTAHKG